ncbi:hypothetical protein SBOR_2348 [Sclerotinia borealis F-4128]|uniref:Rhodopsin domain-containing protein n=1 Tax=Sclerotinia borealis (strain F-4128) TaxID=1432307 RepID=W9CRR0_SCLBF|nr:hypothetical protein SBOR_2348 [Sclerotinia borealis F-4128]
MDNSIQEQQTAKVGELPIEALANDIIQENQLAPESGGSTTPPGTPPPSPNKRSLDDGIEVEFASPSGPPPTVPLPLNPPKSKTHKELSDILWKIEDSVEEDTASSIAELIYLTYLYLRAARAQVYWRVLFRREYTTSRGHTTIQEVEMRVSELGNQNPHRQVIGGKNNHLISRQEHVLGVNRGAQVTGVACASLALPWIAVILRFYVRIRIQKFFGPEDWLTVASMIIFTALCGLLLRSLAFGLGAHLYNIDADYLDRLAKYIFSSELLYVITMAITKVSIGVYFLRLANKRYQFWIIYSVMATALLVSSAYFIFVLLQCQPVSYFWNMFDDGSGSCLSTSVRANVTYAHAAMSAVTDWAYGILPITFVWKIKMNPRTKLSVVLILSLGFFASTATLVRIYYIHKLNQTTDYTWEGINLVKWSIVEPAIALTAASFATLRPLFSAHPQKKAFSINSSDTSAPIGKNSQETLADSEDEYSTQFAAMLGLSESFGVRTYVYADKKIVLKEDIERQRLHMAWSPEELDDSIEISVLNAANRRGERSHSGESHIDWASGYRTTVITQTSE